jgi:cystathionine beta-lyase/cystathionine gamma-synthase
MIDGLDRMGPNTQAVHAGEHAPAPDFHPVTTPIYPAVAYHYDDTEDLDAIFGGTRQGPVYQRYGSPTVTAFERAVALLEKGEAALAFGSGMAAIHTALLGCGVRAGTTAVVARDVYGATYAMFDKLFREQGVTTRFVDVTDLDQVRAACAELKPAVVLVETVSNPLLKVADLPSLAQIAHAHGAALLVDNTFATPVLCRPLDVGADVVIHSATKYIGGHGDALGGVVVADRERITAMHDMLKITGGNLGPFEAWLLLRGLKTMPLRVRQQCANALQVANGLALLAKIGRVIYPGRHTHLQHQIATRVFGGQGYGAMVAFELRNAGRAEVFRFFEALQLVQPATSLGDIYTLVLYPAHSSHRALSAEQRAEVGIGEGLVRLSVGIEDSQDILGDIKQALESV